MGILFLFLPRVRDLRSHVSVTLHSAQLILWLVELLMVRGTWKEKTWGGSELCSAAVSTASSQLPFFLTSWRTFTLSCPLYCFVSLTTSALYCLFQVSLLSLSQCQLWARNSLEHWLYSSKQDRHILPLPRLNSCLLHMSLKPFFPHDSPV